MHKDVAALVAEEYAPELRQQLDGVCSRVVNLFKQDKLSQEEVVRLRAEFLAVSKLLRSIEQKGGVNG